MQEASRSICSLRPTSQPSAIRTRVSGGAPLLTSETLCPLRSETRPLSRVTIPPAGGAGGAGGAAGAGGGAQDGCTGGAVGGPHEAGGADGGGGGGEAGRVAGGATAGLGSSTVIPKSVAMPARPEA